MLNGGAISLQYSPRGNSATRLHSPRVQEDQSCIGPLPDVPQRPVDNLPGGTLNGGRELTRGRFKIVVSPGLVDLLLDR